MSVKKVAMIHKIQILFSVLLIVFSCLNSILYAQERLQAGVVYNPGEQINAPMVGLTAILPEGWAGYLPQDTEMLLLMSVDNPEASIYAFGFDDTMDEIKERLNLDIRFEIENGIELNRVGDAFMRGDVLAANLVVENSTNELLGYAEAKCADYGWCVMYLAIAPKEVYDKVKSGLIEFMDNSQLGEPTLGSLYDNFDWPDKLKDKYLATYLSNPYVKKNNQVWLCSDGTFKSKIQQKGFGDLSKKYKGNRSGTWTGEGKGAIGKLTLNFSKADPVTVELEIKEDKLYIGQDRYYVMEYKDCKK